MIKLIDINKYYTAGDEKLHVLNDINLHIQHGEFVAIMGPSGSGKSTMINLIGFIDRKFEGTYYFEGEPMGNSSDSVLSKIRNKEVGFVFQNFSLIENNTIFENVELPLLYNGYSLSQTEEHVLDTLDKVGIRNKADKFPKQLSGGQQQRAAIARALVNSPKFLIADEPTGALDSVTSSEIMELFQKLCREDGVTIILVTHDPESIKYCDRVVKIMDGRIIEDSEVVQ